MLIGVSIYCFYGIRHSRLSITATSPSFQYRAMLTSDDEGSVVDAGDMIDGDAKEVFDEPSKEELCEVEEPKTPELTMEDVPLEESDT